MKALYSYSGRTVGRYRAVSLDSNDTLLVSENGWIFVANKSGCRVGVVYVAFDGSEEISYHDIKDLEWHLMRIGGFIPTARQAELANKPNLRDRYLPAAL